MEKYEVLIPGNTYHIYNRANGSEKMFYSFENYRFFLRRYQHYISPLADTFCYCLLSNHFHFVVRIKPEDELQRYFANLRASTSGSDPQGFKNLGCVSERVSERANARRSAKLSARKLEKLLSKSFSNLFNSYTKAINKSLERKGSLFMQNFKRKLIADQNYLLNVVHYIHYNPTDVKSGEDLKNWPFSSYHAFLQDEPGFVQTNELLKLFGGRKKFLAFHQSPPEDELVEQTKTPVD